MIMLQPHLRMCLTFTHFPVTRLALYTSLMVTIIEFEKSMFPVVLSLPLRDQACILHLGMVELPRLVECTFLKVCRIQDL